MPTTCSGTVTGMQRTQADLSRRRRLADAAAGSGIQRARVVLYACLPQGQPDVVLAELRAYAEARDWVVVRELVDRSSIGEPVEGRPMWPTLAALIESGQAQGIVTPMRRMCGLREPEQTRLDTWLATHQAFVVNVWNTRRTLASAAGE